MTNNIVLRRLRYTFDLNDDAMIRIFKLADHEVTRSQVSNWLKKEDAEGYVSLHDKSFAIFLNGFINMKRGKREGVQPKPEKTLTNNLVLRKLKIALNLKDVDMLKIMDLADFPISKHELSAFFRKPGQSQYRECKDQILRNFLMGLQKKYRDNKVDFKNVFK